LSELLVRTVKVVSVSRGQVGLAVREVEDIVAEEVELKLSACSRTVEVETSPHLLEELAMGFALSHGCRQPLRVLSSDGLLIAECRDGCVERRVGGGLRVKASAILRGVEEALSRAALFAETGAFHFAAAMSAKGEVLGFVEDVARHCALYKLAGLMAKRGLDPGSLVLVMSSRASSRLIASAANIGFTAAVFRGAPTYRAVEEAHRRGLLLIAFARPGRFNVYTFPERVEMT